MDEIKMKKMCSSSSSSSNNRIVLELSVQVLNVSPRVTLADLDNFFSYCGNVHNLLILRNKDQSSALVTFAHPFAFQTALLLNDAILADQPIRVLPALDLAIPIISDEDDYATQKKKNQSKKEGFIPVLHSMAWESIDMLNKHNHMLEEYYKVSAATTKRASDLTHN